MKIFLQIKNCFKKGGFLIGEPENLPEEAEILPPTGMSAQDYDEWMNVDNNTETSYTPTEEVICSQYTSVSDDDLSEVSDTDDDRTSEKIPSSKEMLNALNILRVGVHHYADTFEPQYNYEKFIQSIIDKNQRQTKIDDFFKRA